MTLLGIIGADDAAWMAERLQAFGVSGDELARRNGNTGVTVSVSLREERSFFSHAGVNKDLQAMLGSEAMLTSLGQTRHVHFALPFGREIASQLLPVLRDSGCTTSLDVGFHPNWLQDMSNLEICRAVDYFFPNEREAALICAGAGMDYLTFARQQGISRPVVKRGQSGAAILVSGLLYESPAPSIAVVDTTGAGDVFDAGFIDAHLDAASPQDCLRRASACGALSTRAAGALSALPDRTELERLCGQIYGT